MVVDKPWTMSLPALPEWSAIIALAVLSTALAYILNFQILSTTGASNLVLVTLLMPMIAIILGSLFLDEMLELSHFTGMVLIGLRLMVIDGHNFTLIIQRVT